MNITYIDWVIIAGYLVLLMSIGIFLSNKQNNADGFFLGNRAIPGWAITLSVVATSLSAGTFLGIPQLSFTKDLTFLWLSAGSILGGVLAAILFVPVLYNSRTITIYGYLDKRFGKKAMVASSFFFLLGQLLSAGARFFIASIAVSLLLFDSTKPGDIQITIIILGVIGTSYTMFGGMQAVIWTDVIQLIIMVGAAVICIFMLIDIIPLPLNQLFEVLDNNNKLEIVNFDLNLEDPYTIWAAFFAYGVFNIAQYGCDQDMMQRLLTSKSTKSAVWSLIYSRLLSFPIIILFSIVGMLLYLFYTQGAFLGIQEMVEPLQKTGQVLPQFIVNHLPTGVIGLIMAGLLAAAMSSFDSAANAMASTYISDLTPYFRNKPSKNELNASRKAVLIMGLGLTLFGILAAYMQEAGGQRLIDFAVGIMVFSYAGLLGVFLTALYLKRGNEKSVNLFPNCWRGGSFITSTISVTIMESIFVWNNL